MPLSELGVSIEHLQGAIAVILIPAVTAIIDYIVQALFDRKVFEPAWTSIKRKYKAWRTKRDKITTDYKFSIYLDSQLPLDASRDVASDLLEAVDERSNGDFEIVEQKWSNDGLEVDIGVRYKKRSEPFELTLNFIPDSGGIENGIVDPGSDSKISSIGVNVTFRFAFGSLRGAIIDLMLFTRFLQDAVEDLLSVRSTTDGRFVVSMVESDLTLDEWIKKEQFDVSLLLESEDGRSSVEFYSNRAVISSPHTEVDDKTVEYIRAALLNYYL